MDGTKWVVHQRTDHKPSSSIRIEPTDAETFVDGADSIKNGEIAQVLSSEADYSKLSVGEHVGWVKKAYLQSLPPMLLRTISPEELTDQRTKWMMHDRTDADYTVLRAEPTDVHSFVMTDDDEPLSMRNGEFVQVLSSSGGCSQLSVGEHVGWAEDKYLHSLPLMLHMRNDSISKSALKSGPSGHDRELKGVSLLNNEIVEVMSEEGDYWKVHVAGAAKVGWVKSKNLHDVSILDDQFLWMVHRSGEGRLWTRLRKDPSNDADTLRESVKNNEVVKVIAVQDGWCRVQRARSRWQGWLPQHDLYVCLQSAKIADEGSGKAMIAGDEGGEKAALAEEVKADVKAAFKGDDPEEMCEVFRRCDFDKNGLLDKRELGVVLRRLNGKWSEDKVESLFASIDKDSNEHLDLEEFVAWLHGMDADQKTSIFKLSFSRLSDAHFEPDTTTTPFVGLFDNDINPRVRLKDAIKALPADLYEAVKASSWLATKYARATERREARRKYRGLTEDGVAAIHLYTEETPGDVPLYGVLNTKLRSKERYSPEFKKEFYPYMRILMTALNAMTGEKPEKTMVNRGVAENLVKKHPELFEVGKSMVWWSFSSCTKKIEVLENPMFLGTTGNRTIFQILTSKGVTVDEFSACEDEMEYMLPAGTVLKIDSILNVGAGLTIIQCSDDEDAPSLLGDA